MITLFDWKGNSASILMVLMELTFSFIKDDNVYEENDDDVFQSEGKYQWFFDGLYKLQLFNDLKM